MLKIDQEIETTPKWKSYYCPHCHKILMKGEVKYLNMICQHCHRLINAEGDGLLNTEN